MLIFPEGERTESGLIGTFRAGVGLIGARLAVPIVPVRLDGVDRVLHKSWKMARPGRVRVAFGRPLTLDGDDYAALAAAGRIGSTPSVSSPNRRVDPGTKPNA